MEDVGSFVDEVVVDGGDWGEGGEKKGGRFGDEVPGGVGGAVLKDIGLGCREILVGVMGLLEEGIEAVMADEAVVKGLVVPAGPVEEAAGEGVGKAVEAVAGAEVGREEVVHEGRCCGDAQR